jgi:peroxiredoxin
VDLQANLEAFTDAGAQILAVAVFSEDKARQMRDLTGAAYPLLADADHQVSEAYGVYDLLGDGLAAPAVFIIDRDGRITWSYVGEANSDRPSSEMLLEALDRD